MHSYCRMLIHIISMVLTEHAINKRLYLFTQNQALDINAVHHQGSNLLHTAIPRYQNMVRRLIQYVGSQLLHSPFRHLRRGSPGDRHICWNSSGIFRRYTGIRHSGKLFKIIIDNSKFTTNVMFKAKYNFRDSDLLQMHLLNFSGVKGNAQLKENDNKNCVIYIYIFIYIIDVIYMKSVRETGYINLKAITILIAHASC